MDLLFFRVFDWPVVPLVILAVVAFVAAKVNSRLNAARAPGTDPLQAAEVYLAYGRKEEAVEILNEGIKAYPRRRKEFEAKLREVRGLPAPAGPVTKL